MQLEVALTARWLEFSMMPKLASQLVTLELCGTSDVWPVIFQLQALTSLHLSVVSSANSPANSLPAESSACRMLASLERLKLTNCTASISPLFVAASLPKLKTLSLESCSMSVGFDLEMKLLNTLEELRFTSCPNITIKVISLRPKDSSLSDKL